MTPRDSARVPAPRVTAVASRLTEPAPVVPRVAAVERVSQCLDSHGLPGDVPVGDDECGVTGGDHLSVGNGRVPDRLQRAGTPVGDAGVRGRKVSDHAVPFQCSAWFKISPRPSWMLP